jgi:archaellum component FlaG (FlaF/FlaG flagellin family)
MASIKAHVFTTEKEAQQAIDIINEGEGIPVSEDAVTRTYTNYQTAEDAYYIAADDVTEKYLGEATDLELPEIEII